MCKRSYNKCSKKQLNHFFYVFSLFEFFLNIKIKRFVFFLNGEERSCGILENLKIGAKKDRRVVGGGMGNVYCGVT